jgi:hypothetical protein
MGGPISSEKSIRFVLDNECWRQAAVCSIGRLLVFDREKSKKEKNRKRNILAQLLC